MKNTNIGISKRKIKFRAWNSDKKKMVKPETTRDSFMVVCGVITEVVNRAIPGGYYGTRIGREFNGRLMQYTGLLDKNGKEIYEGDQLHICAGYSSVVEFQDAMFVSVYSHPEDGEIIPLLDAIGKDTVIVGRSALIELK